MMNTERQKDYLNLLAGQHPTIESASTGIREQVAPLRRQDVDQIEPFGLGFEDGRCGR